MGIGIHGPDRENPREANVVAAAAVNAAAATSSLERTLDEATERYSVSLEGQRELSQLKAGLAGGAALEVSGPRPGALSRAPGRLRWRGHEVSEEFQRYAERVASGEELAPYRGQVLARPCVDSPWGAPEPPPPPPARRSVVFGALLAASAWLVGVLLIAPRPPTSNVELSPLSNAAVYASFDAPSQLGSLSLDDVEPLGDVASAEVLSRDDGVARALSTGATSQGTTRTVSAHRSRARSSGAEASARPLAGALPAQANEEVPAVPEAPAPPAAAVDDFDWLLDAAGPADGAGAAADGDTPARVIVEPLAPSDSELLLEKPPF